MNPLKDCSEVAVAALRDAGARGRSAHPSVNYYRKRAQVTYFGGPPASVLEDAFAPLLASGVIKRLEVYRYDDWTCGTVHNSPTHAWAAHEGRDHVEHIADTSCELGCDHGGDYVDIDKLAKLVAAGETFVSAECRPLVWPDDYPHAVLPTRGTTDSDAR